MATGIVQPCNTVMILKASNGAVSCIAHESKGNHVL